MICDKLDFRNSSRWCPNRIAQLGHWHHSETYEEGCKFSYSPALCIVRKNGKRAKQSKKHCEPQFCVPEFWGALGSRGMRNEQLLTLGSPGATISWAICSQMVVPHCCLGGRTEQRPPRPPVFSFTGLRVGYEKGGAPTTFKQSSFIHSMNIDWSGRSARYKANYDAGRIH